ncbi:MAG: Gfo/Idh/MocA family oxidoreductase [Nitrospinota bacterium]|nr:Gfo/Idh/MocA family oxidoreductase [Nitrospinota bacterium]
MVNTNRPGKKGIKQIPGEKKTAPLFKVALIGCGRIGWMLEDDPLRVKPATHAGGFSNHPKTKITSACDINKTRLHQFGERYGIDSNSLYTDFKDLLKNENPDIVSIATWTEHHCEMVIESAKNKSVKGIYCEKPISLTLKEAERMNAACKKRGIPLVIGHERRFDSNFVKIKNMIDDEVFGKLRTIVAHTLSSQVPKLPVSKFAGGTLFHDGTHLFDLVLYFGGAADYVVGFDERDFGRKYIESTAVGFIKLKNGVNVLFEGGGRRKYFKFDLDMQFERGRILIGNSGIHLFGSKKSRHYTGFFELEPIPYKEPKNRKNAFVVAVDEIVRSIKNGHVPRSNGEEGKNSLELILSIYKSASKGGKKVKIGGKNRG